MKHTESTVNTSTKNLSQGSTLDHPAQ